MKRYEKPYIVEETVEILDIIALSGLDDSYDPDNGDSIDLD